MCAAREAGAKVLFAALSLSLSGSYLLFSVNGEGLYYITPNQLAQGRQSKLILYSINICMVLHFIIRLSKKLLTLLRLEGVTVSVMIQRLKIK